jgi:hypothetical protein
MLGSFWEAFGQLLGSFWAAFGQLWAALGNFWAAFWQLWAALGNFWAAFGQLLGTLWAHFGHGLGCRWGRRWATTVGNNFDHTLGHLVSRPYTNEDLQKLMSTTNCNPHT